MITDDRKAILCDLCNRKLVDEFTYYSINFDKVKVISKLSKMDVDKQCLNLDICQICYTEMSDKVLNVIKKRSNKVSWDVK